MHPNKIIEIEIIAYAVLYGLVNFSIQNLNFGSGGDAAGNGMEKGYLMMAIIALFLIIAIIITIVNLFLINKVNGVEMKLLAFAPLAISLAHITYTILN